MRLIDADKLNIDFYDEYEIGDDEYAYGYVSEHQIDTAPSIEIIRCGECKHYVGEGKYCQLDRYCTADDFCSYGSRSEKPNNSTISKMEQVGKERSE